ncbi:hypothetical protein [Calothrix sp. UHCC 0171]|uniref:hypothetical protein n=1 Tax=Calothrix sp. UHCC 0171 TaxID=3110245 RepID=UPI002B20BFA2|nr:hypothetical protein [Calothrix sp. UHCC 0171]MEA5570853.1 hypothetical protein [Calothrix sp. UHCC 0171]
MEKITDSNILELAKQGDTNAINTLVYEWLGLTTITTKTNLKQDCLQIMLESTEVPEQQSVVRVIRDGLIPLSLKSVAKVKVLGRETGEDFPDWQEEFELKHEIVQSNQDSQLSTPQPSLFNSIFGAIAEGAGAAGGVIMGACQKIAQLDGVITKEEAQVLTLIKKKLT